MPKLKMPPNCIDVTLQHRGTIVGLLGAEVIRKQIAEQRLALSADRPTLPQGFVDVLRERGAVRAIIGYPTTTTSSRPGNDTPRQHEGRKKP